MSTVTDSKKGLEEANNKALIEQYALAASQTKFNTQMAYAQAQLAAGQKITGR